MRRIKISADVALIGVLAVSIGFNFVLVYGQREQPQPPVLRPLWAVDTIAPPLTLHDFNGNERTFDWDAQTGKAVIYVFSPDCQWCDRNLESVRALVEQGRGHYRVIPVALIRESELKAKPVPDLGTPSFLISSSVRRAGYRLGGTPQTVVIDKGGRVLANWVGAYTELIQPEVRRVLGVEVPTVNAAGLLTPPR